MKQDPIRQVVFPILAALIWGTAFVAQDVCADTIGTFTFNAARYFIAVLALLVLIAVRSAVHKDAAQPTAEEKRAGRRQLWLGGFCCGTALAIASNFQQAGIVAGTDAGKAGFLFRSTEKIKKDYPQLPAFEAYDELLSAIRAAL